MMKNNQQRQETDHTQYSTGTFKPVGNSGVKMGESSLPSLVPDNTSNYFGDG